MFVGHHLVFVMEVKPKTALHPQIAKRLDSKVCICGCGDKIYRNGLSRACHYALEKDANRLAPEDRPSFINKRIRRGLFLTAELVRFFKSNAMRAACGLVIKKKVRA